MVSASLLASINILGGLVFGYNSGIVAVALDPLNTWYKDHHHGHGMSATLQGLFTASVLFGAALGSLLGGWYCDKFGRKITLITVAFFGTVGPVFTALSPNLATMMVARGVVGIGVGLSTVACPTYVSENAKPEQKGMLGTLFQLAITFGIFISYLAGLPFAHVNTHSGFNGFRIMFLLGVVPGVCMLLQAFVMPESAPWLGSQRSSKNFKDPLLSEKDPLVQRKFGREEAYLTTGKAYAVGELLAVAQQLTGINAFMFYGPAIFKDAGINQAVIATVGIGAWNFITTFVATFLVDRLGRRPLLLSGTLAMALSTIGLTLVNELLDHSSSKGPLSIVLLFIFIAGFEAGEGPLYFVVCTELFPPESKSTGLSVLNASTWTYNLILTFGFLPLVDVIGQGAVFGIFGGVGLVCVTLMYFFLPETKRAISVVEY